MEAFKKIYTETHPKIEKFVMRKVSCKEDAEEIASEVFVKVHANFNNFDGNLATMNTWIFTIAKNLMIDYWRKQKEIFMMSLDNSNSDDEHFSIIDKLRDESNPQKTMESNEIGESILNAMVSLPKSVSAVAEAYFVNELTYKEIAKELNVPLGTVKAHIFRAKQCLRNRLIAFR